MRGSLVSKEHIGRNLSAGEAGSCCPAVQGRSSLAKKSEWPLYKLTIQIYKLTIQRQLYKITIEAAQCGSLQSEHTTEHRAQLPFYQHRLKVKGYI